MGPIASLARFHVVKMEVSYHILLGRPWLHKILVGPIYLPSMRERKVEWQNDIDSGKPVTLRVSRGSSSRNHVLR